MCNDSVVESYKTHCTGPWRFDWQLFVCDHITQLLLELITNFYCLNWYSFLVLFLGYQVLAFTIGLPITLAYLVVRTNPYNLDEPDSPDEFDEMAEATAKLFRRNKRDDRWQDGCGERSIAQQRQYMHVHVKCILFKTNKNAYLKAEGIRRLAFIMVKHYFIFHIIYSLYLNYRAPLVWAYFRSCKVRAAAFHYLKKIKLCPLIFI